MSQATYHLQHKCSLILRLWRSENSAEHDWRAAVEIPEVGKRYGFSSLEQLFAFLIDFTEDNCDVRSIDHEEKENNRRETAI